MAAMPLPTVFAGASFGMRLLYVSYIHLGKHRLMKNFELGLLPVLPWGSWQEVAGAGSQGTEPRSMIWDGTLTDR